MLERVAKGAVVMSDEMDAVRTIYPTLYNDARARLVTKAVENAAQVPLARRLQLSLLFDIPLDGTMQPDYANFLQMSYQPPAPAPQAQAPMPSPTIAADVTIGQTANPYRI